LFLLAIQVFNLDLTITTGFSAKNLVVYLIATFLALRMVISRTSVAAAGSMQAAWLILIVYALASWLIAAQVVEYPGYDLVESAFRLKAGLVDYYIFFLVFLFGVQTAEDGMKVVRWLLVGAVFANAATMLDTVGLIHLGYVERLDGRTQGAMGESNQYAAYIVLFIPGMVAEAVANRGWKRFAWVGGALLSCGSLAMTASRGGIVGMLLACAVGAYLYRHLVSYSRIAGWVFLSLVVLVIFMSLSQYGGLLNERLFGVTMDVDPSQASSERTEIWKNLLLTMAAQPLTFLTGFGWDVYWTFPFRFSPHNHYLSLWFNLGLVGLLCTCYLLFGSINRARRASLVAEIHIRRHLIAYVMGAVALCGAVFFVEIMEPWIFFWMYAGTAMRLCLCAERDAVPESAAQPAMPRWLLRPRTAAARDSYGWLAPERR